MIMQTNNVDPKLSDLLNNHKHVPARNPQAAARGRARFLAQAAQLREAAFQQGKQRRNGWVVPLFRRQIQPCGRLRPRWFSLPCSSAR